MSVLAISREKAPLLGVQFDVVKLIEVEPALQSAAESAITAVWRRHMNEPTSVNLSFASAVILQLPNGTTEPVEALYQGDTDTIMIALGTLREHYPEAPLEVVTSLYAAHEARHKVHYAIGDIPPDRNEGTTSDAYLASRHEVEAWESAMDAFSDIYPYTLIDLSLGSRTYTNRKLIY